MSRVVLSFTPLEQARSAGRNHSNPRDRPNARPRFTDHHAGLSAVSKATTKSTTALSADKPAPGADASSARARRSVWHPTKNAAARALGWSCSANVVLPRTELRNGNRAGTVNSGSKNTAHVSTTDCSGQILSGHISAACRGAQTFCFCKPQHLAG